MRIARASVTLRHKTEAPNYSDAGVRWPMGRLAELTSEMLEAAGELRTFFERCDSDGLYVLATII